MIGARGFDHVGVSVADLDRSVAFYGDVLGLDLLATGESHGPDMAAITGFPGCKLRWAELDLGSGRVLEVLQYLSPTGEQLAQRTCDPGSAHIGLLVEDIEGMYRRLLAEGAPVRSAPVTIEEPGPWSGVRVLYAVDPDGFTVELVERPR